MKVAATVILLFRDKEGFGTAIADALHPNASSSLRRSEDSFELSLESYGIKDCKASGNLIHFADDKGSYQVTVLLLQTYEPPILACAVHEVLAQIMGEQSSTVPTFLVPYILASSKLKLEPKTSTTNISNTKLHGVHIGPETDIIKAMVAKTHRAPPSLEIQYEPVACFLQLVHVLNLPTFVLIGQRGGHHSDKAAGEELEILHLMGENLASTSNLCCLKDKMTWKPTKVSKDDKAPWRALYG